VSPNKVTHHGGPGGQPEQPEQPAPTVARPGRSDRVHPPRSRRRRRAKRDPRTCSDPRALVQGDVSLRPAGRVTAWDSPATIGRIKRTGVGG